MRIIAWLSACCVGIALTVWLLNSWEVSSERIFLLPEVELTLASAHADAVAAMTGEATPSGFLLEGHHVSSGGGVVLAYRRQVGYPFALFKNTETAKFEYLTISLRDNIGDKTALYDFATRGGGHAFWSAANFGFSTLDGCYGFARKGTITINPSAADSAKVDMRLDIQTRPLSSWTLYSCGPVVFSGEYQVEVVSVAEFEQALTTPRGRGDGVSGALLE